MIWKQPISLKLLNSSGTKTMVDHLGIEFSKFGDDFLEATMPVDYRTIQPAGLLHGGANVSLAETIGSVASVMCIEDLGKQMPVGLEINANHLKGVTNGSVTGHCTPVRIGRTIHVWNIEIRNEEGQLTCISRFTVAIVPRR